MFEVNTKDGMPIPAALTGGNRNFRVHRAVRLAPSNEPVWIVEFFTDKDVDGLSMLERFLATDFQTARSILIAIGGSEPRMSVLLPGYLTRKDGLHLVTCQEVWECLEPDDDEPCWLIFADDASYLLSMHRTEPAAARKQQQVWPIAG